MEHVRIGSISRLMVCFFAIAALVLAPTSRVQSAAGINRYVSPGGSDTTDCTAPATPCQTITYALDQSADGDTLLLDAGVYTENLAIDKGIRIVKDPSKTGTVVLDGGHSGRVIDISSSSADVSLERITVQNGQVTDDSGAGIYSLGNLTLDYVIVQDNTIVLTNPSDTTGNWQYRGGGIDSPFSTQTLTIRNSSIHDNAANDGGGISSIGTLVMIDTQVYDNSAQRYGGGIWVPYGSPTTLENSTLWGNSANEGGGGMYVNDSGVPESRSYDHVFHNVTINGNSSTAFAGGLASSVRVELDHVTLANNDAPVYPELSLSETQAPSDNAHSLVTNSILSNSTASVPICYVNQADPFDLSGGDNIASDDSCGLNQSGDLESTDPLLLPLADNGGPVKTMAIPADSPAVDHAGPFFEGKDARGVTVQDGDQNGTAVADSGAYEFVPFYSVFLPLAVK